MMSHLPLFLSVFLHWPLASALSDLVFLLGEWASIWWCKNPTSDCGISCITVYSFMLNLPVGYVPLNIIITSSCLNHWDPQISDRLIFLLDHYPNDHYCWSVGHSCVFIFSDVCHVCNHCCVQWVWCLSYILNDFVACCTVFVASCAPKCNWLLWFYISIN